MRESWYLANDMQYYLISPFLVYPIWRWGTIGLTPLVALLSASLAANVNVFVNHGVTMILFPKGWFVNGR